MIGGLEKILVQESISSLKEVSNDVSRVSLESVRDAEGIQSLRRTEGGDIERPDMSYIECTSRNALMEQNRLTSMTVESVNSLTDSKVEKVVANTADEISEENISEDDSSDENISEDDSPEGLSDDDKTRIKEETGWSDEIIENIQNMDQYEALKKAGLIEVEINGRKCLIKENIDLDYTDADGISNRQRIALGQAPLDSKTGKPIELHHLGQNPDSPLVELTVEEHRTGEYKDGKKNQSLWHDNSIETSVHGEDNTWNQERKTYWKARATIVAGGA